jgi:hypothetical protein
MDGREMAGFSLVVVGAIVAMQGHEVDHRPGGLRRKCFILRALGGNRNTIAGG